MAGRRLLDAARLFGAGASIAKQHIVLRRQQIDVFTKTSSLAAAVKRQTDRVTVTVGAAVELGRKLNETGPQWREDNSQETNAYTSHTAPSASPFDARHAPAQSSNINDLYKSQGLHHDGAAPTGEGFPTATADTQPVNGSNLGQDTFNQRSGETHQSASSLPYEQVPAHAADADVPSANQADRDVNQDVFPDPSRKIEAVEIPKETDAESSADALSSIGVSRISGRGRLGLNSPYGARGKMPSKPLPEMIEASERWQKEREAAASIQHAPKLSEQEVVQPQHDADTADLASSIAADVESPKQDKPYEMRESRVPSSRFGRLWQYGGLATSMAFGAMGEGVRRMAGGTGEGSLMLSEANINRLVAKLSRMRGAALKLGQMISFSDSKVLPATISTVMQRVQDSADYMPASQRDKVLIRNLGPDWRSLFSDFAERPFAAASIGQVHRATLASTSQPVAVKIQYPGVRSSIDSDLSNLSLLLTASNLLPRGLFLDKTIANARTELGWECDYTREAHSCTHFRTLLASEASTFAVPEIFPQACGPDVLTAEFMPGTAVTKIADLSQSERDHIGSAILRLCLRELMEWQFMQTDPNWTNFLYNRALSRLELLDFGASRSFPLSFVEPYISLLIAASKNDRLACQAYSIELGYLTGSESPAMLAAHVDSILTLAEPFLESAPEVYDFSEQTITERVRANIGLMLRERQRPPPEETYSLHRKLSGAFLLCAKLRSRVRGREMFAEAVRGWEGRERGKEGE